jgi:hypothetical protein
MGVGLVDVVATDCMVDWRDGDADECGESGGVSSSPLKRLSGLGIAERPGRFEKKPGIVARDWTRG